MLPFSTVEKPAFRQMMTGKNPNYKPISSERIVDRLRTITKEIQLYLVKQLKGIPIALTIDHWTSRAKQNYSGMTVHWVDSSFTLQARQLGCFLHDKDSRSATLLDDFLEKLFRECNLENCKITAVVSDTTSCMNNFGRLLENLGIHHIYCTDHVLQLTSKMAFNDANYAPQNIENQDDPDDMDNEHQAMKKCRSLVEFFSKSAQNTRQLKEQQKLLQPTYNGRQPVTVVQDVVTRWWSTYSMLERLLYLKPAIASLGAAEQIPRDKLLTEFEWKIVAETKRLLEPFRNAQKGLEGEKYASAPFVPVVIPDLHRQLESFANDPVETPVKYLARNMLTDFKKRWGDEHHPIFTGLVTRGRLLRQIGIHPLMFVASALDPRIKLCSMQNGPSKQTVWDQILNLMVQEQPGGPPSTVTSRTTNATPTRTSTSQ